MDRRALDASMDGVALLDASGRFAFSNEAHDRMYGYARGELVGRDWRMLCDPSEVVRLEAEALPVLEATGRWQGPARGRHKDGTEIAQELSWSRTEDGGRIAFVRNLSDRERELAALMHAHKLESLAVLAGGVAHDFNNLLVGILGNASLALNDLVPEDPLRRTVERIELAGRRAAELTRQMLAYAGKAPLARRRLDVSSVAREMASLLEAAVAKDTFLETKLGRDLPEVEGDAVQVRQAVMNLVVNASEALRGHSGTVCVSTCVRRVMGPPGRGVTRVPEVPAGEYVALEVSDTGCGMGRDVRERIFDPFFTTKADGRGLGLAVVMGVARSHRGAVEVQSEPGRGSTFRVLFPRHVATSATTRSDDADAPQAIWRGKGRVLLVDDEARVRRVVSDMLRSLGYEPVLARDGVEGLATFQAHQGDFVAVLLDVTMPYMSGEDAFREIRRLNPEARVVLMSGFDRQEVLERLGREAPEGFLEKPFTLQTLSDRLRRAVLRIA